MNTENSDYIKKQQQASKHNRINSRFPVPADKLSRRSSNMSAAHLNSS
jgi:hypothetical protein